MQTKRRLYAKFSIADDLVVDLSTNDLVYVSQPADGDYPEPRRLRCGEAFRLMALNGPELPAAAFLYER